MLLILRSARRRICWRIRPGGRLLNPISNPILYYVDAFTGHRDGTHCGRPRRAGSRDPEIFFNVLFRRAEPRRGTQKNVAAVPRRCFKELRKAGIHRARLGCGLAAAGVIATEDGEVFLRVVA